MYILSKRLFPRFPRPSMRDEILIRCHIRNHSSTLSDRNGTPLTHIELARFSSLIIILWNRLRLLYIIIIYMYIPCSLHTHIVGSPKQWPNRNLIGLNHYVTVIFIVFVRVF